MSALHENPRAVHMPSASSRSALINDEGFSDFGAHYELWLAPLSDALGPTLEFDAEISPHLP